MTPRAPIPPSASTAPERPPAVTYRAVDGVVEISIPGRPPAFVRPETARLVLQEAETELAEYYVLLAQAASLRAALAELEEKISTGETT